MVKWLAAVSPLFAEPALTAQPFPSKQFGSWSELPTEAHTSRAIVNPVNAESQQVLGSSPVGDKLQEQDLEAPGGLPAEFGASH